jgi:N-acetylglucosamine repressor
VLNVIKRHGAIDRAEIARAIGLSPATITSLTGDLLDEGLILEADTGESRGGRRPILLSLNPKGGYAVGLKIAEKFVIGALIDLNAKVLAKRTDELRGQAPEEVVEQLAVTVASLRNETGVPKKKLLGVGAGLAGVVDAENGVSRQHPFLGWRDVPLRDMLNAKVRVPVYIDNDVNTLTLAERWYGAGQGVDDFLVVTVGRGVGLGIAIKGQLYRGARGGGGEFGHTVIDEDGPLCDCGKHGCLEAFVGERALMWEATRAADRGELPRIESIEALVALGQEGNATAVRIYQHAGEKLGRGIANLINLFNPELILISGEGAVAGDLLFQPMRESIRLHTMPALLADTKVHVEAWGDDAWALGAASLVLRELFESPVHRQEKERIPVVG